MDTHSQSSELGVIEDLWTDINKAIKKAGPKHLSELFETFRSRWNDVSPQRCAELVDSMLRRFEAVISAKCKNVIKARACP